MATVTTGTQKVNKAFYATLYDEPGTLTKIDGEIFFMATETGEITAFGPEMAPWTCILGEIGLCETQAMMDKIRGGAAALVCARRQEAA